MKIITRKRAIALGLKKYFTGKPCKHGHVAERDTPKSNCLECHRIRSVILQQKRRDSQPEKARAACEKWRKANPLHYKNWYWANRDEALERGKAYRIANKGKWAAKNKKWLDANLERKAQINSDWRKANLDKCSAYWRNYTAKKRNNGGSHTAEDIMELFAAQNGKCVYCKAKVTMKNKHVDHIIPLSAGGSNDRNNLQITCRRCNLSKGSKDPIEFAKSKGLLL